MIKIKDIDPSLLPKSVKEAADIVKKYLIEEMKDESFEHEEWGDIHSLAMESLFLLAAVIKKEKSE